MTSRDDDWQEQYIAGRRAGGVLQHGVLRRSRKLIQHLDELNCSASDTLVDIGTADGLILRELLNHYQFAHSIGVDKEIGYLMAARDNVASLVNADGKRLPFASGSIDTIVSSAVLKHVPGLDELFAECSRVLKPDGKLVVVDPTPLGIRCGLLLGYFQKRDIVQMLGLDELARMLLRHQFTVVRKERFMLFPVRFAGSETLERVAKTLGLAPLFLNQVISARSRGA
jgi:SAM-dependent methyltransferase